LRLKGAIGLATRLALDDMLEQWRAHVRYLEVSDAGLIAQPSEDDLDCIGRGGFIRAAVDRLRARADDPGDAASDAARLALRILYVEHVRTGA
ncbi:MAG: metallophosphoesterase family protein, partial [Rhodoplanes sp.]